MSEVEGECADVLHESVREATTAQVSTKPVSVSEPDVTFSHRTWYPTSSPTGNTLATMARFFGPVGSAAIQEVVDSWCQEQTNYSTLSCAV